MTTPGGVATVHEYDMEDFFKSCVALYEELAPGVKLKQVATPFLNEDHRDSPARAPTGSGPVEVCPWCENPHASNRYKSIEEYDKLKAQQRKSLEAETSAKTDNGSGPLGPSGGAYPYEDFIWSADCPSGSFTSCVSPCVLLHTLELRMRSQTPPSCLLYLVYPPCTDGRVDW